MSLFRRKPVDYFSPGEKQTILNAIHAAERASSGEVRVFIENRCYFVDPVDRAKEIFGRLHMEATKEGNAVLLYVAMKDRQLAVWGDTGIHEKVGDTFWNTQVKSILQHFTKDNYAEGIATIIEGIGQVLGHYFPHIDGAKNELPDEIVFGK
jgi:uncharacterized membrane protein YgcG